jgi:Ca2+-transporting ATPase
VPGLYRNETLRSQLAAYLQDAGGFRLQQANVLTGTILVLYDRKLSAAEMMAALEAALAELLGAVGVASEPEVSLRRMAAGGTWTPSRPSRPTAGRPALRKGRSPPVPARRAEQPQTHWHSLATVEVVQQHGVAFELGLSAAEAAMRLQRYGPNALTEAEARSPWQIFLGQFDSLPIWLLLASAGVSVVTGGVADAAVILAVVGMNAAIGYATESQAERTINALTKVQHPPVPVLREGRVLAVPSREVVPGEVLLLTPGCFVAADARLVQVKDLSVDESALTGESLPVAKAAEAVLAADTALAERINMVYMGTAVTGGSALAVVVATGPNTELGLIQALVGETRPPETPMQRQLDHLGNQLVWISGAACLAVFGIGLLRGYGLLPMLQVAISLAVAAVPEGLPTVATTTLALGLKKMHQQKVLIRHLAAVETLGAVQVICLDKTGTLTLNRMSVVAVHADHQRLKVANGHFYAPSGRVELGEQPALLWMLRVAILCNESQLLQREHARMTVDGSATENALLVLAMEVGIDVTDYRLRNALQKTQYRTDGSKYMATWHAGEQGDILAVKGSPEQVLGLCRWHFDGDELLELTPEGRDAILAENERMAGEAMRVLGFAMRVDPEGGMRDAVVDLTWVGLAGLADPIREGTRELMGQFHAAGIKTVMITGDQSATAYAIGRELALSGDEKLEILDSNQLGQLEPELLSALSQKVEIFSRVSPANKLQIVQALQRAGKVVAMTGDGINDGPALKAADIGVAMGAGGTDVARTVADVVLEDDELQTMIIAVSEGRTIYSNIRKSIHYLVSSNMSEIGITFVAVGGGLGQPLNTMQLLWINLMTDVLPALALAMDPAEPDVLQRPPRDPAEPIIRRQDFKRYGLEALSLTSGALVAYVYGLMRYGPGPQASTLTFMSLTLSQLLHAISCRSESHGLLSSEPLPPNRWLTGALAGSAALQVATVAVPGLRGFLGNSPMALSDVLVVAGASGLPYVANEAIKRALLPLPVPVDPPIQGRTT